MRKFLLLLIALVHVTLMTHAGEPEISDGILKHWPDAKGHIKIPDGVKEVAKNCFYEETESDDGWGSGEAVSNTDITSVDFNGVTKIGENAFKGCTGIKSVIADNVEVISDNAFESCTDLNKISLPSIKKIGVNAFAFCTSLTEMNLGNKLESVKGESFNKCEQLSTINISSNAKYKVKNNAIINSDKVLVYLAGASTEINLSEDECVAVEAHAMKNNTKLTKVILPGVLSIGKNAFMNCMSLSEVCVPKLESIDDMGLTWSGASSLRIVDVHESKTIKTLGSSFPNNDKVSIYVSNEEIKNILARTYHKAKIIIGTPQGVNSYVVNFSANLPNAGLLEAWKTGGIGISDGEKIPEGMLVCVKAVPYVGYKIKNWIINNHEYDSFPSEGTLGQVYTNKSIKEPLHIVVNFEKKEKALAIFFGSLAGEYGSLACKTTDGKVLKSGDEVAEGTKLVFTATPNAGYRVTEWYVMKDEGNGDKKFKIDGQTYKTTYTCSAEDMLDIRVDFDRELGKHIVKFVSLNESAGTVTASVDGKEIKTNAVVADGAKVVFTAHPNAGYRVDDWLLDNDPQTEKGNTFVIESLKSDVMVSLVCRKDEVVDENKPKIENGHLIEWYPEGDAIIPDGVKVIDSRAFVKANKMTSLHITKEVNEISELAFLYCFNLERITVDKENPYFAEKDGVVFTKDLSTIVAYPLGDKAEVYTIPSYIKAIKPGAFATALYLRNVNVDKANPNFSSEDGVVYSKDGSSLIFYPTRYGVKDIKLKEGIVNISRYALAYNPIVDKLQLPSTLKTIESDALAYNFTMSMVKWADGVRPQLENIGERAFEQSKSLLAFPHVETLKTIGDKAFAYASALDIVYIPADCKIGEDVFLNCWALKNVYSYSTTPQVIAENTFHGIASINEAVLHVVKGCDGKYRAAQGWNYFKNIVADLNATMGIDNVLTAQDAIDIKPVSNGYRITGIKSGLHYSVYTLTGSILISGMSTGNELLLPIDKGQVVVLNVEGKKAIKLYRMGSMK